MSHRMNLRLHALDNIDDNFFTKQDKKDKKLDVVLHILMATQRVHS